MFKQVVEVEKIFGAIITFSSRNRSKCAKNKFFEIRYNRTLHFTGCGVLHNYLDTRCRLPTNEIEINLAFAIECVRVQYSK